MSYTKHEFKSGDKLYASQLNEMDDQIKANEEAVAAIPAWAKAETKPSYSTSELDNDSNFASETFVTNKIAEAQLSSGDGTTVDLSGYLTEEEAAETYQPIGEYLTEHQSIKTVNGLSLVGTGNITISGDGSASTNYWSGKKLVWNGDSISAGSWLSNPSTTAYPQLVGKALGMNVHNYAIGGSFAAMLNGDTGGFEQYYWSLSDWNAAKDAGTLDTSKQYLVKDNPSATKPCKIYVYKDGAWTSSTSTGGWALVERVKEHITLHPDADLTVIAVGTNDFYSTAGAPFGEADTLNYRNLAELEEGSAVNDESAFREPNGINLIDDLIEDEAGKTFTSTSAEATASSTHTVAYYIAVTGGKEYYMYQIVSGWWYTAEKEPISYFEGGFRRPVAPENAAYVSVSYLTSNAASASVQNTIGYNGTNLIDPSTVTYVDGVSLNSASYKTDTNANYCVVKDIPVTPGKKYKCNVGAARAWWLDSSKAGKTTVNLATNAAYKEFTAPSGVAYISITFMKSNVSSVDNAWVICMDDVIASGGAEAIESLTKYTFCGAIHSICRQLLEAYKNKDILFITPIKRFQPGTWDCRYPEDENYQGKTLKDYSEAIKEICSYYSIPVLDFYSISGMNPHIDTSLFADTDGKAVHPNEAGHQRMASLVIGYLEGLRK